MMSASLVMTSTSVTLVGRSGTWRGVTIEYSFRELVWDRSNLTSVYKVSFHVQ